MNIDKSNTTNIGNLEANKTAIIYTDGSYNSKTYFIGCAFLLLDETGKRPYRIAFGKKLKTLENYGSCIAEMIAVVTAIKAACSLHYTQIIIFHDWDGIAYFSKSKNIKSRHKACPEFSKYAICVDNARKNIDISFVKVKAHSDNEYNCLVDKMAKSRMKAYSIDTKSIS